MYFIFFLPFQVCCSSENLDQTLKKEISGFSEALRCNDGPGSGQISLEFFQKKKNRWPFQPECIPWEVWNVRLELIKLTTEHGSFHFHTWFMSDVICTREKVFVIILILQRGRFAEKRLVTCSLIKYCI